LFYSFGCLCFSWGCAYVEKEGDSKEFVKNHNKGFVTFGSFGTKCKRQRQLLVTPPRAKTTLEKPPIPKTFITTLPILTPILLVVDTLQIGQTSTL
jgi:hypothetical protein